MSSRNSSRSPSRPSAGQRAIARLLSFHWPWDQKRQPSLPSITIDGVAISVSGAQLAIIDGARVLVQFRPWPPGWEFPGGHSEPNEDPAATAQREAEEETGYRVRIIGLIGVYTWQGLRHVGDALYCGEVVGGSAKRNLEAWTSRFVDGDHVPRTIFPWYRQRVADALEYDVSTPPVHRVQRVSMYQVAAFATEWLRVPVDRFLKRRRSHHE